MKYLSSIFSVFLISNAFSADEQVEYRLERKQTYTPPPQAGWIMRTQTYTPPRKQRIDLDVLTGPLSFPAEDAPIVYEAATADYLIGDIQKNQSLAEGKLTADFYGGFVNHFTHSKGQAYYYPAGNEIPSVQKLTEQQEKLKTLLMRHVHELAQLVKASPDQRKALKEKHADELEQYRWLRIYLKYSETLRQQKQVKEASPEELAYLGALLLRKDDFKGQTSEPKVNHEGR
jgi:hypothetical protein